MKRAVIWVGVIIILVFLNTRMLLRHVNGVRIEKVWYIEQLGFEFSGELDSTESPKNVLFHVTKGELDTKKEDEIKKQLKFNGTLDLLLYRKDGKSDLWLGESHPYAKGDSMYLNTGLDIVRFYRNGELLGEHSLLTSLRGRPF